MTITIKLFSVILVCVFFVLSFSVCESIANEEVVTYLSQFDRKPIAISAHAHVFSTTNGTLTISDSSVDQMSCVDYVCADTVYLSAEQKRCGYKGHKQFV